MGLTLFGPFDKGKVNDFNIGIIGTKKGVERGYNWFKKIHSPILMKTPILLDPFSQALKKFME